MKIVKPYAKMLHPIDFTFDFTKGIGIGLLRNCEYAARVSHRTEDKITDDSYEKILRFIVMQHGDFSVIEHANVTVEAVVDRGITHEWVRHRLGAYTQESTRFVNYSKKGDINIINPFNLSDEHNYIQFNGWAQRIEDEYFGLLKILSPQIARSILPNALASKIIVTYNLRMWRHFFLMRTSKESHPQMREVTIPLLKEFQEKIPIIYEDIIPENKQSENLKMMR